MIVSITNFPAGGTSTTQAFASFCPQCDYWSIINIKWKKNSGLVTQNRSESGQEATTYFHRPRRASMHWPGQLILQADTLSPLGCAQLLINRMRNSLELRKSTEGSRWIFYNFPSRRGLAGRLGMGLTSLFVGIGGLLGRMRQICA